MSSYNYESILVEKSDDGILTATLNRPDSLNAINPELHLEIEEFFREVAHDEVRAIILTGAGRAFCAGGDVKGMKARPEGPGLVVRRSMYVPGEIIHNLLAIPHPVIAALNGDAIGLGATLALCCDIVVMNEAARIADTHVKVGLVAGDGGAVIWPHLIGVNKAKEFLMRGALVKGAEAERIGLVNYAVPPEEVMPKARELAAELAQGAPWAIRWTKMSVNKVLRERANLLLDTSLAYEWLTMATQDHREATTAFVEKRRPNYTGR